MWLAKSGLRSEGKNVRKCNPISAAVVCAVSALAVSSANATILPQNSSVPPNAQPNPLNGTSVLASTGNENFNVSLNGSTMSGTVTEYVVTNYNGNIFGSSNVSFVFQVQLTGGSTPNNAAVYLQRIADSGFAGVNTDVGYTGIQAVGVWNPSSADRSSGGDEVAFNFTPPANSIGIGDFSSYLIVNTNTTQYAPSVISLQGTLATSLPGFSSSTTPEPATLGLGGIAALGLLTRRRRAI